LLAVTLRFWSSAQACYEHLPDQFEDDPRRNSLIFAVHMWNPMGPEPETIWERALGGLSSARLVGEGRRQLDLSVGEWSHDAAREKGGDRN
jgi:hypothetical protein